MKEKLNELFKDKVILITGGSGYFSKNFTKDILQYPFKKLILFSHGEEKLFWTKKLIVDKKDRLRFVIGDIRDKDRLKTALTSVDYVIHTAAIKHIDFCEYDPFEAAQTNIIGGENLIKASVEMGVKKIVALSTDKSCNPINLYGATKMISDKFFQTGWLYSKNHELKTAIVRYGNVCGSSGSIIPILKDLKSKGINKANLTHESMTRFWITIQEAIEMVYRALLDGSKGEIFIKKIPSFRVSDLFTSLDMKYEITGMRPCEKLHEAMIQEYDRCYDYGDYYVLYPHDSDFYRLNLNFIPGGIEKTGMNYTSDKNIFLSIDEIKERIKDL